MQQVNNALLSPHKFFLLVSVLIGGLCFCLQAEGQSTGSKPNLVPNPGFENIDKSGWVAPWSDKPPMFTASTEAPRSGTRCLRFENYDPKNYMLCSAALKFETGKRYEISGWVRTENVIGEDSGATLCVEWYGRNGEYLGGTYLPGIKGTNRKWQQISGRTDPIRKDAANTIIACYLRKGMTGVAWWGDLTAVEYIPSLVDGITTDRYRNTTNGG